jgi:hypothetical protein
MAELAMNDASQTDRAKERGCGGPYVALPVDVAHARLGIYRESQGMGVHK